MKMFFCNGKKDFCGNNNLCLDCDFMDHSGGEYREVPVTNADRIRAMSDEELADFIESQRVFQICGRRMNNCFPGAIEAWLQQPTE